MTSEQPSKKIHRKNISDEKYPKPPRHHFEHPLDAEKYLVEDFLQKCKDAGVSTRQKLMFLLYHKLPLDEDSKELFDSKLAQHQATCENILDKIKEDGETLLQLPLKDIEFLRSLRGLAVHRGTFSETKEHLNVYAAAVRSSFEEIRRKIGIQNPLTPDELGLFFLMRGRYDFYDAQKSYKKPVFESPSEISLSDLVSIGQYLGRGKKIIALGLGGIVERQLSDLDRGIKDLEKFVALGEEDSLTSTVKKLLYRERAAGPLALTREEVRTLIDEFQVVISKVPEKIEHDDKLTLNDVGSVYVLSVERVRQIITEAERKLRKAYKKDM